MTSKTSNEIYQFSVVSALMDGVASNGLPLTSLLEHGDTGLGTFRNMEGELIILDGQVFQILHDGTVKAANVHPDGDVTPFAQVTHFAPTTTTRAAVQEKNGVDPILARLCPLARNTHVAFRLHGTFKSIACRTAAGQCFPREGLAGVTSRQRTVVLGPLKGTVVGFRTPRFLQGVGVGGVHMHFIDEERRAGGHVLALESEGEVEVEVAEVWRTVMDLPRGDEEFNDATLELDHEGIEKAEG